MNEQIWFTKWLAEMPVWYQWVIAIFVILSVVGSVIRTISKLLGILDR